MVCCLKQFTAQYTTTWFCCFVKINPNLKVRMDVSLSLFSQHTYCGPSLPTPPAHTQINHLSFCSNLLFISISKQVKASQPPTPSYMHTLSLIHRPHTLTLTLIHTLTYTAYMHAHLSTHTKFQSRAYESIVKKHTDKLCRNFLPSVNSNVSQWHALSLHALLSGNLSFLRPMQLT